MAEQQNLVDLLTVLGHSQVPSDAFVHASLEEDYFSLQAGDVMPGSKIVWKKDSVVKIRLKDVEPFLPQSPRYARALHNVFSYVGEDKKIPILQDVLIKAIAAQEMSPHYDLENRLREGTIPDSEFNEIAGKLREAYLNADPELPERSKQTFENWVKGKTLAPRDPDILLGLAVALEDNTFLEWYDKAKADPTDITSLWGARRFYAGLRQHVMKRIAEYHPKATIEGDDTSEGTDLTNQVRSKEEYGDKSSFNLTPDIELVLNEFISEVSEDLISVKVLQVRPIEGPETGVTKESPGINPNYGAYTDTLPGDHKTINLAKLLGDEAILDQAYSGSIREWLLRKNKDPNGDPTFNEFFKALEDYPQVIVDGSSRPFFAYAFGSENLNLLRTFPLVQAYYDGQPELDAVAIPGTFFYGPEAATGERVSNLLLEAIDSGSIDETLEVEKFATYRLREAVNVMRNSIPNIIYDRGFYLSQLEGLNESKNPAADPGLNRSQRRSLNKPLERRVKTVTQKLNGVQRRIQQIYGMDFTSLPEPGVMLKPQLDKMRSTKFIFSLYEKKRSLSRERSTDSFTFSGAHEEQSLSSQPFFPVVDYEELYRVTHTSKNRDYGLMYVTEENARIFLERKNFGQFSDFIDQRNFVFEKSQISKAPQTSRTRLDYGHSS